jgi:hypothetical protein
MGIQTLSSHDVVQYYLESCLVLTTLNTQVSIIQVNPKGEVQLDSPHFEIE